MVNEGKGRIFQRSDGRYFMYLPKGVAEDSMFPFKEKNSIFVKISFDVSEQKMIIEYYESGNIV
jgi:hypothetical protein